MIKHIVQPEENFHSIAQKYDIEDPNVLRLFHNLHCPEDDIMHEGLIEGKEILIPNDLEYKIEQLKEKDEITNSINDDSEVIDTLENKSQSNEQKKESVNETSNHKGKHFVIQKGICQCNQGFKLSNFKVTSHQKHYWNSPNADANYLAVTEDDVQLSSPSQPFGKCKLRPTSGGYLPCIYAPVGKWQKTYEKVKVLGKSCLTEISELMCSTGGKITVTNHGQQVEMSKGNFTNADTNVQQTVLPVLDYDEFKEVLEKDEDYFI